MGIAVTFLQCKCLNSLMIAQGDLMKPRATKSQNQMKRKPRSNGATRVNSEILEWLQEFRENLVDDEIPLQ